MDDNRKRPFHGHAYVVPGMGDPILPKDFAMLNGDIIEGGGQIRPPTTPDLGPLPRNRHERRRYEKRLRDRKKARDKT